jgi:hypothetical protein
MDVHEAEKMPRKMWTDNGGSSSLFKLLPGTNLPVIEVFY